MALRDWLRRPGPDRETEEINTWMDELVRAVNTYEIEEATMSANFTVWGTPYRDAITLYKDAKGRVFMDGLIKSTNAQTTQQTMCTIPEGWRPDEQVLVGLQGSIVYSGHVTTTGNLVGRFNETAIAATSHLSTSQISWPTVPPE